MATIHVEMSMPKDTGGARDASVSSSNLNSESPSDSIIDVYATSRDLTSSPLSLYDMNNELGNDGGLGQFSVKPTRIPQPSATSLPLSPRPHCTGLIEEISHPQRRHSGGHGTTIEHQGSIENCREYTNSSLFDLYHRNYQTSLHPPMHHQYDTVCTCLQETRALGGNVLKNYKSQSSLGRPTTPHRRSSSRMSPKKVYHTKLKRIGYVRPSSPSPAHFTGSARTHVGFQHAQEYGVALRTSSPRSPCPAGLNCRLLRQTISIHNRSPHSVRSQSRVLQPGEGHSFRSSSGSSTQSSSTRSEHRAHYVEDYSGSLVPTQPHPTPPRYYDYTEQFEGNNLPLPELENDQFYQRSKTSTGPGLDADSKVRLFRDPVVNFPHSPDCSKRVPHHHTADDPSRARKSSAALLTPTRVKREFEIADSYVRNESRPSNITIIDGEAENRTHVQGDSQIESIVGHCTLPSSKIMTKRQTMNDDHDKGIPKRYCRNGDRSLEKSLSSDATLAHQSGLRESHHNIAKMYPEASRDPEREKIGDLTRPENDRKFPESGNLSVISFEEDASVATAPEISIHSPIPEHWGSTGHQASRLNSLLSLGNDSFSDIATRGLNLEVEGRLGMLAGQGGSVPSLVNFGQRVPVDSPARNTLQSSLDKLDQGPSGFAHGALNNAMEVKTLKDGKPRADSATMGLMTQRKLLQETRAYSAIGGSSLDTSSVSTIPHTSNGLDGHHSYAPVDSVGPKETKRIFISDSTIGYLGHHNEIPSAGGPSEVAHKFKVKRRSRISTDELEDAPWAFSDYDWATNPENLGDTLRLPMAIASRQDPPKFRIRRDGSTATSGFTGLGAPTDSIRNLFSKLKTDSKRSLANLFASGAIQAEKSVVTGDTQASEKLETQVLGRNNDVQTSHFSDDSSDGANETIRAGSSGVFNATKAPSMDERADNRKDVLLQESNWKPSRLSSGAESYGRRNSSRTLSSSGLSVFKTAKCKIKRQCKQWWQRGGKRLRKLGHFRKKPARESLDTDLTGTMI